MLFYGLICRFTASPMQHSKLPWFTLLPLSSRALKKANAQLYQPMAQRKGTPLCPTCCSLGNSAGKYGLASFQVINKGGISTLKVCRFLKDTSMITPKKPPSCFPF